MSIWATFWSLDAGDHADTCGMWMPISEHAVELDRKRSCTCGQPGAPYAYQGSHVLPSEDDARGGYVSLSLVPSHITRDGRDDQPEEDEPYPWVRVSLETEDVVIGERQAAAMYRALGEWLMSRQGGEQL